MPRSANFSARLDPRDACPDRWTRHPASAGKGDASGLTARFRSITEMPAGKFPHLFAEAFARAFVTAFRHNNGEHSKS